MNKRLLSFFLAGMLLLAHAAFAAEPAPGDSCPVAQRYIRVGGPETGGAGYLMVCGADNKWKPVMSSDAAGNLTKLGNQTCNAGEFLKFDGTKWVCAASSSLPTCSEGEGLIYTSGAWVCQPQTPDAFSFIDQTNITLSTLITSNPVTITGISGSVSVSVSGGGNPKIRIGGTGGWVSSGTIANNQTLEVQLTSSASNSVALSAVVTVGASSDQWDVTTKPACIGTIGAVCPDGSIFAGDTNLYVADADQSSSVKWSTETVTTSATSATDGPANQAWVVDNKTLSNYPAFQLCENLNRHGHTDWYLPAKNELNVIYPNKAVIGGFTTNSYWSSTEQSFVNGWVQQFSGGFQGYYSKGNNYAVRCVRRG